MKNIKRAITLAAGLSVLLIAALGLGSCASAQERSDSSSTLVYGFVTSDDNSTRDIYTLTIAGVTDSGRRVVLNARFTNTGLYYVPNLEPGRYLLTELVFKDSDSTWTFYLDRKNSFYRAKEEIKRGFDVKPGQLFYVGNLKMNKVPGKPSDPPGTFYFRQTMVQDPDEIQALEKLAKVIKKGPWFDLANEKIDLLKAQ